MAGLRTSKNYSKQDTHLLHYFKILAFEPRIFKYEVRMILKSIKFVIFFYSHAHQNRVLELFLAKFKFCACFLKDTRFLDFCDGACNYDVTKATHWGQWYFIRYKCFEDTISKLNIGTKINMLGLKILKRRHDHILSCQIVLP